MSPAEHTAMVMIMATVDRILPQEKMFLRTALKHCAPVYWEAKDGRLKLTLEAPEQGLVDIICTNGNREALNHLCIDLTLIKR